jgi:methylenetetrahydrofolate reductase (NADPH)
MKQAIQPMFSDITWGAGGSTADLSLDIALSMHQTGHCANLHMTCTNLTSISNKKNFDDEGNDKTTVLSPKDAIRQALTKAYDSGIRNIVALRGDPPAGTNEWTAVEGGFTCALDLVHYMRTELSHMDWGISVAGYPEGHPNAITNVTDRGYDQLSATEQARCSTAPDGQIFCCLDDDYQKELVYLKQKVDAGAGMY